MVEPKAVTDSYVGGGGEDPGDRLSKHAAETSSKESANGLNVSFAKPGHSLKGGALRNISLLTFVGIIGVVTVLALSKLREIKVEPPKTPVQIPEAPAEPKEPSPPPQITPGLAPPQITPGVPSPAAVEPKEVARGGIEVPPPATEVAEEVERVTALEKQVDAILETTKDVIDSIAVDTNARQQLDEKFSSLCELKRTHSMLLMDNVTLQDFTAQVSALKAVSLYLRTSMQVRAGINDLKGTLERLYGSPELLGKMISTHIAVSTKSVEMGNFVPEVVGRAKLDPAEQHMLIKREKEAHTAEERVWQAQATELVAQAGYHARVQDLKAVLENQLDALSLLNERLSETMDQISAEMNAHMRLFEWSGRTRFSINALKDYFEASTEVSLFEMDIWTAVAKGGKPHDTAYRHRYHDAVTKQNIGFDVLLDLREASLLPRDLVRLMDLSPSLQSPELKSFEVLQQRLIKWGDTLMRVVVSDAEGMQQPSIFSFRFRDLLWRPFLHTWLMRLDHEKELIRKTNAEILQDKAKEYAFDEALAGTDNIERPSVDQIADQWHKLPVESKICSNQQQQAEQVALQAQRRVIERYEEKRKFQEAVEREMTARRAAEEVQKVMAFLLLTNYRDQLASADQEEQSESQLEPMHDDIDLD